MRQAGRAYRIMETGRHPPFQTLSLGRMDIIRIIEITDTGRLKEELRKEGWVPDDAINGWWNNGDCLFRLTDAGFHAYIGPDEQCPPFDDIDMLEPVNHGNFTLPRKGDTKRHAAELLAGIAYKELMQNNPVPARKGTGLGSDILGESHRRCVADRGRDGRAVARPARIQVERAHTPIGEAARNHGTTAKGGESGYHPFVPVACRIRGRGGCRAMGHRSSAGRYAYDDNLADRTCRHCGIRDLARISLASERLADQEQGPGQQTRDDGIRGEQGKLAHTPLPRGHHAGMIKQAFGHRHQKQHIKDHAQTNQSD